MSNNNSTNTRTRLATPLDDSSTALNNTNHLSSDDIARYLDGRIDSLERETQALLTREQASGVREVQARATIDQRVSELLLENAQHAQLAQWAERRAELEQRHQDRSLVENNQQSRLRAPRNRLLSKFSRKSGGSSGGDASGSRRH